MKKVKAENVKFHNNQSPKLYRSSDNRIIAGVCAGIAEYFNIDPVIIRIIFIILFISHGSGLIIYLILWLIIPTKSNLTKDFEQSVKSNFVEIKKSASEVLEEVTIEAKKKRTRNIWGLILIIFGIVFLLENFGIVSFDYLWRFWPLSLIVIGYFIFTKNDQRQSR